MPELQILDHDNTIPEFGNGYMYAVIDDDYNPKMPYRMVVVEDIQHEEL